MRRAARRDENEPEIIAAALRWGDGHRLAIAVERLSQKGVPDLLIGTCGRTLLVEVKNPGALRGKPGLTDDQLTWHGAWPGHVAVVETPDDLVRILDAVYAETLAPKRRTALDFPGEMSA